jgi:hypothetical protein
MTAYMKSAREVEPGSKALPLFCDACEAEVLVLIPVDMRTLSAVLRAFGDDHAECVLNRKGNP